MTREVLPKRRYSENTEFAFKGIGYSVQIGFYEDGRVGEVFSSMLKASGTPMDVAARDNAILISMALQHGIPIEKMLKSITRDENGEPEGLTGALLQMLLEWQEENLETINDSEPPLPIANEKAVQAQSREEAQIKGYTGDQCTECKNFTMVRNGTCLKCDTCGTTTGCS